MQIIFILASLLLGILGTAFLPDSNTSSTLTDTLSTLQRPIETLAKLPLSDIRAQTAQLIAPAASMPPEVLPPYRKWDVPSPEIDAKAAIVVGAKSGRVLYERNMRQRLPIASLTKLATALIAMDEFLLYDEVAITRHAVSSGGDYGNLVVGERLTVHDLLRAMLIASSNDAAIALADHLAATKGKTMTELMNAKAYALHLANTHFASVSGLEDRNNYASAEDVARIALAAIGNTTLSEILHTANADIHALDGKFTHRLVTSNKLLNRFDGVIAGKTGYTTTAGGTLAIVAKNAHADDDFIVVILGSTNEQTRFEAAETLITWVDAAYRW
ncbi:MAG: serine hydrolase [bacterium]|nr:serine hydrolase [bacterium]